MRRSVRRAGPITLEEYIDHVEQDSIGAMSLATTLSWELLATELVAALRADGYRVVKLFPSERPCAYVITEELT